MYYADHPPAHFHVLYGEHEAVVKIDTLGWFAAVSRAVRSA